MRDLNTHRRYLERSYDESLCSRKIGKTTVDCGFLSSKSQWGVWEEQTAGLLRLTLTFHEPADYKLSSAEVQLCFLPSNTSNPPHITEHLYPDVLCGPPLSQHKTRNRDFEPSVEALGGSAGGIGLKDTADWEKTFRWLLRGSRLPDDDRSYTIANWQNCDNTIQSTLGRVFNLQKQMGMLIIGGNLALVLAHTEPCINTTVNIKGKLQKGWRRYTFGYLSGSSKDTVRVKLCPSDVELASIVKNLAATIISLNTGPVAEHQPVAPTPAASDTTPMNEESQNSASHENTNTS